MGKGKGETSILTSLYLFENQLKKNVEKKGFDCVKWKEIKKGEKGFSISLLTFFSIHFMQIVNKKQNNETFTL